MIDQQAELVRLIAHMEKHMPHSLWAGVMLQGGRFVVAFSVN